MTTRDDQLLAAVADTTAAAAAADQARLDAIRAALDARVPGERVAAAAGYRSRASIYKLLQRRGATGAGAG